MSTSEWMNCQLCDARCPACGVAPVQLVWVHGHGQCGRCGQNVEPCCQPQDWPQDRRQERAESAMRLGEDEAGMKRT